MNVFTDEQVMDMLATRLEQQQIEKFEARHAAPHILELVQNIVDAESKPFKDQVAELERQLSEATTALGQALGGPATKED